MARASGMIFWRRLSIEDSAHPLAWWFFLVLRCILGAVFLYAGISKVGDPAGFARDIANYRLMPEHLAIYPAIYLPYLEIVIGAALITRWFYQGAIVLSGGLLGMFVVATVSALIRGLDISCGCFGNATATLPEALARNIVLAAVWAAVLWWFFRRTPTSERATDRG